MSFILARRAAARAHHPLTTRILQPIHRTYSDKPPPPPLPPNTQQRPSAAPRPIVDIRHIRENAELYAQNCLERNYVAQSAYPGRIVALHERRKALQRDFRDLRARANELTKALGARRGKDAEEEGDVPREELIAEAREVKGKLADAESEEGRLTTEMENLAFAIPNLTSQETPRGEEPRLLTYINEPSPTPQTTPGTPPPSHVDIGTKLGILDFSSAATTSGWGWYFLLGDGARLEQALIQFTLDAAMRRGWTPVSPPSIVYSHISSSCGFQPRDQNGEQQIYTLSRADEQSKGPKPELSLTGTAEIPLAAMKAKATIPHSSLPLRYVASSRCYRAEAGARGADTKGLYRVHEFTKVELFAWTSPDSVLATEIFDDLLDLQTDILSSLGLHCRVLEMPSTDLGASAYRKCDIETFFPSRVREDHGESGWGELTSTSICTDYQARRLGTRLRLGDGSLGFPWSINGTGLAVPRVLAALLEAGWDGERERVNLPECLWELMGKKFIGEGSESW